jgi:hypothetical protein
MINNIDFKKFFIVILGLILSVYSISYADSRDHRGEHRFYRYHDHPHLGVHVNILPNRYSTVWAGRQRYYYSDGLYYSPYGREYVIVQPPVGAFVNTVPVDFSPIVINGITYYTNNGIYYLFTPKGYQVIANPIEVNAVFTVNVPNSQGSYIPVIIKKSGNGYIGPEGEFYPQFPTVSQLKTVYGK